MTVSTWKRLCSTVLVILVPILLVPWVLVGIFHVDEVGEPMNSLIMPIIWTVGLFWVWRPSQFRRG
jgi:hypothetical protein